MALGYRGGISVAQLIFYAPALAVGIVLCLRHGFGRNAGFLFLCIFALARIVGAGFQLATISDPTNVNLYIGESILQGIGLSPLELVGLALLSRVVSSINKCQPTFLRPVHLRFIQLLVMVALILGIVGGVNASSALAATGKLQYNSLSQAGSGLLIASFVALVIATAVTSISVSYAEPGEKRILLAIALTLPFIAVRLVYAAVGVLGGLASFNNLSGDTTIYLCMSVIMEVIAVIIFESFGMTLNKVIHEQQAPVGTNGSTGSHTSASAAKYKQPRGETRNSQLDQRALPQASQPNPFVNFLATRTMVGRIVSRRMDRDSDVEMQRPRREIRRTMRSVPSLRHGMPTSTDEDLDDVALASLIPRTEQPVWGGPSMGEAR